MRTVTRRVARDSGMVLAVALVVGNLCFWVADTADTPVAAANLVLGLVYLVGRVVTAWGEWSPRRAALRG